MRGFLERFFSRRANLKLLFFRAKWMVCSTDFFFSFLFSWQIDCFLDFLKFFYRAKWMDFLNFLSPCQMDSLLELSLSLWSQMGGLLERVSLWRQGKLTDLVARLTSDGGTRPLIEGKVTPPAVLLMHATAARLSDTDLEWWIDDLVQPLAPFEISALGRLHDNASKSYRPEEASRSELRTLIMERSRCVCVCVLKAYFSFMTAPTEYSLKRQIRKLRPVM